LKDNDVPIKDAQMTLGHASIQTTMQIYQHSSLASKNKALTSIVDAVAR
jgi:integrase